MSLPGLKKLTIEHLRGSVFPFSIPFEKGRKLMILYGENGTGKSTVCDAFEFLGKGKVGSLENRGLGRPNKFWPSLGKHLTDISVTLDMLDGTSCRASVVKTEVIASPMENRPRVEVLRRTQILKLIEATASSRYEEIKRFIDVTGIEASEANLRELYRDLTKNREVAIARVLENQGAILQFWESAGRPETDPLVWANVESKRDLIINNEEVSALISLQSAYSRLMDFPDQIKKAQDILNTRKEENIIAQNKVQDSLQKIALDAGEVINVLEAGRAFLHKHPSPTLCPLCESNEKVKDLGQRINSRLDIFSALQSAKKLSKTTLTELQKAEQQLETLRNNVLKHDDDFSKVFSSFNWPPEIPRPTMRGKDIDGLEAWLTDNAHLPAEWKRAEIARHDRSQFVSTLKRVLKTYHDNVIAQKELDLLLPKLNRALEIIEEERRIFTDAILSKISGEVGRLYELVHPGEGLNKISLELDPKKRAALEIGTEFCGEAGAPPQAYFSDSHLDTLGLCVFLALAALEGPDNTILVLDDVLASVDEPHVERLIEMFYMEAIKYRHCLITTHYRPWKEKLRWGWLKNGQCHYVELSKWTSQRGMTITQSIPDAERLRKLLSETPPDLQLVCAKAGVILEAALDFITQLYECHVPRRAGGLYTLGELLNSINKKLRSALEVEVSVKDPAGAGGYFKKSLMPVLDELTRISQVRNVFGCHFNALSFDLLDSDALGFGQYVLQLIELLADPEFGWPRSQKSGKFWSNSGETRRLYPLKHPF